MRLLLLLLLLITGAGAACLCCLAAEKTRQADVFFGLFIGATLAFALVQIEGERPRNSCEFRSWLALWREHEINWPPRDTVKRGGSQVEPEREKNPCLPS